MSLEKNCHRLGIVSVSGGRRLGLVSVSAIYVSCPRLIFGQTVQLGHINKMFSYRRDRAAGCIIVLAKSGRLQRTGRQYFTDIIGLF